MAGQRRVKHQRLSGPEAKPRNYDFLSPWCDVLAGHLMATDNVTSFGDYEKLSKKQQPKESLEDASRRKREALALLLLVGRVDQPAWQDLLEQKCRVRYEVPYGDSDDDDGDDDEGSVEGSSENYYEAYDGQDIEAVLDDVDLTQSYTFDGPRDRPFIPARFKLGTRCSYFSGDRQGSPIWEWLLLPGFQCSAEYVKAKNRILEMQSEDFKRHPWVGRTLAIPISLDLEFDGSSNNNLLLQQLVEARQLLETVKRNTDQLDAVSTEVEHFEDCAASYTFDLEGLSITMDNIPVSDLKASGVMEVLGAAICPDEPRTANTRSSRCAKVSLTMRVPDARKLVSVLLLVRESGLHLHFLELEIGYCSREGKSASETREGFAQLIGEALTYPSHEHAPSSIETLSINCFEAVSWQVEALFSAFGASQISIGNIYLSGGNFIKDAIRSRYWRMLGNALLHVPSCKCGFSCNGAHSFEAPNLEVGDADLRAMTSVLRVKEAQTQESTRNYVLRQGTQIRFTDGGGQVAGTPISLPSDLMVRLVKHENRNGGNEISNVIVPGYGECQVFRQCLLVAERDTGISPGSQLQCTPLTTLMLCVQSDGSEVAHLLKYVGWSLQSLSLKLAWIPFRAADANTLLPSILRTCPLLTSLTLRARKIDLDRFVTIYEQFGDSNGTQGPMLTTLKFRHLSDFGEGNGVLLAQQLGDPATRLGQHLTELTISSNSWERPFDSQLLAVLWTSLSRNTKLEKLKLVVSERNFTDQWARRFREFNGQVLSPHPLQQSSKLALLSVVCRQTTASDSVLSAVQRVDERALSLIFEFAATRVARCVQVSTAN